MNWFRCATEARTRRYGIERIVHEERAPVPRSRKPGIYVSGTPTSGYSSPLVAPSVDPKHLRPATDEEFERTLEAELRRAFDPELPGSL